MHNILPVTLQAITLQSAHQSDRFDVDQSTIIYHRRLNDIVG